MKVKMDICNQWKKNRLINPRTSRKIKPTGRVYKDLEVECSDAPKPPIRRVHYSPKCLNWYINPNINPDTGRIIKIGGPTYLKLEKECGGFPTLASPKLVQKKLGYPKLGSPIMLSSPGCRGIGRLDSPGIPKLGSPGSRRIRRPASPASPGLPKLGSVLKLGPAYQKKYMYIEDDCDEWKNDPTTDPATGSSIDPLGKIYKLYEDTCGPPTDAPQTSWFSQRLQKGLRINNAIRSIKTDQWNVCLTGANAPAFRANLSNIVKIGKGSFGQVYRATLVKEGEQLVIKEAYLNNDEKKVLKEATKQNQKWESLNKKSYPRENKILDLINKLLLTRKCPNFVYVYNMAMCDGCLIKDHYRKSASSSCYVTFMESMDTDLKRTQIKQFDQQLSVLYQMLIAVHAIHRYYGIWHRDIKSSNIFIQVVKPGGYFEYVIGGKSYFVKNAGFIAYIADFGVSEILSPAYALTNYYGNRNAEVMRSTNEVDGSYLYWKPISVYGSWRSIDWYDSSLKKISATRNEITCPSNIKSSVPIRLKDNMKFPPFEFFGDIQDVIRIFVGGNQSEQRGTHKRMQYLSNRLEKLINEKKAYLSRKDSIYHIHGTVKYILASEMLDQLYIEPTVDNIVDRFVM
jgi:serine/threonine protein kinase